MKSSSKVFMYVGVVAAFIGIVHYLDGPGGDSMRAFNRKLIAKFSSSKSKEDPDTAAMGRYRGSLLGQTCVLDLKSQHKARMHSEGWVNREDEGKWSLAGDVITTMFPDVLGSTEVRHWKLSPIGLEDLDNKNGFNMQRVAESN
jgi:hypothetical protein